MNSDSSTNTLETTNALLQLQLLGQLFSNQQHQIQARQQHEVATLLRAQHQQLQQAPSPILAFLQQSAIHNDPSAKPTNEKKDLAKSSRFRSPRNLNERQELLIFVKVLFRFLKTGDDEFRLMQAKTVLAECTLRNRVGDADYKYLKHAVESRLRCIVGELYWARAKDYLTGYCQRRGLRQAPPG